MKKLILPIFTLLTCFSTSFGQSKIGFVDYDYVINLMPEVAEVQAKLDAKQKGYEASIESMKKEMQAIETEVQGNPTMDEMIRESKARRYQSLQQEMQDFAYQAQEKMQVAEIDLLKPVYAKLDQVIAQVAAEKGFDFILTKNNPGGYVVVFSKNESDNITKAVLTKMGIAEPKPATTTGTKATESLMVNPR